MKSLKSAQVFSETQRLLGASEDSLIGKSIRIGSWTAEYTPYKVQKRLLGASVCRLFTLADGNEIVALASSCENAGIYFLNHEAGMFSVEDLDDEDNEELHEFLSELKEDEDQSAEERLAVFVDEYELEKLDDLATLLKNVSIAGTKAPTPSISADEDDEDDDDDEDDTDDFVDESEEPPS